MLTLRIEKLVAGGEDESVTDTVKLALPGGPEGEPLMTPVALIERPAGSAPALMLKVLEPFPPVVATVTL